ncbi:hypothetical protein OAX78_02075, partial [Planctomycetota bacterium]|nr:hypothetical protein [Planctomycetota bacterium]
MTDSNAIPPDFPLARLRRALQTATEHEDPDTRERALAKAARWDQVLTGMSAGTLSVGSRTPVANTPAWVTLEVAQGGFATGGYVAEGPLLPHEQDALAALPAHTPGTTDRERLNLHFLSDTGQEQLISALRSGGFRVDVPEEGALLVVAWLLDRGQALAALDLVETLRPLFHRLRFFPRLTTSARPRGATVCLRPASDVAEDLRNRGVNPRMATLTESLHAWAPLYDRLVALWSETVEGQAPRLDDGRVTGGWPCKRWPTDWTARRDQWLSDYAAACAAHTRCGKHAHPKSNFRRLREALAACAVDSSGLTGRDVGWIRRALANTNTRRGNLGSPQRTAIREQQAAVLAQPAHTLFARLGATRLEGVPKEEGLPSLDPVTAPFTAEEGPTAAGLTAPGYLVRKVERALEAPIDDLIQRGVIRSSETLAQVLPQITSQVAAAGVSDPGLRELYGQIYSAFRRRRSLLLLNLEHQVRIGELPWVAALDPFRRDDLDTKAQARQTLEQVTLLALSAFPQTMLPNPLVREMTALVKQAGLRIPLVEEVAADIFMGTFTPKWRRAARTASRTLAGSVYAHYYSLPAARNWPVKADEKRTRGSKAKAKAFADLCRTRAREAGPSGAGGSVARNGTVLEQSQILTTQNLAALVYGLKLKPQLKPLAASLAERALAWVVGRHVQKAVGFRAQLRTVKNTAYAWRQAVFFMSLCNEAEQTARVDALEALVAAQDPAWAARFAPAVVGLRRAVAGKRFDAKGHATHEDQAARRFLG